MSPKNVIIKVKKLNKIHRDINQGNARMRYQTLKLLICTSILISISTIPLGPQQLIPFF